MYDAAPAAERAGTIAPLVVLLLVGGTGYSSNGQRPAG